MEIKDLEKLELVYEEKIDYYIESIEHSRSNMLYCQTELERIRTDIQKAKTTPKALNFPEDVHPSHAIKVIDVKDVSLILDHISEAVGQATFINGAGKIYSRIAYVKEIICSTKVRKAKED